MITKLQAGFMRYTTMRFHSPIGSMYVHLPLKNKQMWANTWYIDGMGQMIRPYMCSSLNSKGRMPTPNYRRGPNKPYIWGHSFFKSSFWASTLNLWKLMLWKWSFLGYHLLRCYVCYMFLPGTLASKFDDNTHTHTHTPCLKLTARFPLKAMVVTRGFGLFLGRTARNC